MSEWVKKVKWNSNQIELRVDGKLYDKEVVMKAAYELVDENYVSINTDWDDFVVLFKDKGDSDLAKVQDSFGEELIYHHLRDQIDEKTWSLKAKIIETALWYGFAPENLSKDVERMLNMVQEMNKEWYDKNIDDVIKEIEDDPDFDEDKDEIIAMLKEIEKE